MPYVGRDAASFTTVVDVTVADDLTVTDDATIGGDLAVTGAVAATAGITVVGSTTVDDIILTAVALPGAGVPSLALRNTDNNVYLQSGSGNSVTLLDSTQDTLAFFHEDEIQFNIDGTQALVVDGNRDVIIKDGGNLYTATAGTSNLRLGVNAGDAIASGGNYNVCVGDEAGTDISTGDQNVFIGYQSGFEMATGGGNVAVGDQALKNEDGHGLNTAVGTQALFSLNAGADAHNVAVGFQAGASISTGKFNTVIGSLSGDVIAAGEGNVALGYKALSSEVNSDDTTAIGHEALFTQNFNNGARTGNTAVGFVSGNLITSGNNNTFLGSQSGATITTGSGNTMIGTVSGQQGTNLTTGSNNICVGFDTGTAGAASANNIVIGVGISCTGDNNFVFGKASNIVENDFDTDAAFSRSSDERLKKNIENQTLGLDFINDLRTVKYNWKASGELDASDSQLAHLREADDDGNIINYMNTDAVMHNFIAQEVKAALDTAKVSEFGGWKEDQFGVQQVSREMFVIPLVKAVQELSTALDAAVSANTALAARVKTLEDA